MSEGGSKKAYSVDAMNLTSVQRIDPCAIAIVDKSTHAALYNFDATKEEWTKTDIEGPLLIYKRADRPAYSMIIANRQSLLDHIEPITSTLRIWEKSPYIFFKKTEENEITGLWFYEREDCKRIYNLLTKLLNENSTQSPPAVPLAPDTNFDVLSLLSRTHDHNVTPPSGEHISNTNTRGTGVFNRTSLKDGGFEMPVMLQKLLCEESTTAKRTMPVKGAVSADQIEKQFVHGDASQLLLDRLAINDIRMAPNCSSASLAALSTTAVGGSDSGTIPDEMRNAAELKRSSSADDTTPAPVPLTKEQMLQALTHLLRTDDDFVVQLHRAYVDSLNYRLGL
uniref:mRNA-decapping enzyme C-terminal domain-containing protein n=1 Tax=Parascaris univalens TaxID=6257 RepID=A0A914ZZN1_PARUN